LLLVLLLFCLPLPSHSRSNRLRRPQNLLAKPRLLKRNPAQAARVEQAALAEPR